ncbi:MAG: hybrid sensor histidine kinase/response regulator [Xenococcaceae cyanobacterium MO_188.B29]|nr:hybrid sensor histidine kinase/response regulator [Xenococcaceae cyanobacterium MO_188.B29]
MITDPVIRDQAYQYFLEEAPELLETIEQELFAINDSSLDRKERALRVNNLMRATHTLKGGAANVGLETIKTVAHHIEDVFKALYNPELEIDRETKKLLYEIYECLRDPLTAEFSQISIDHEEVLNRSATVFAELQSKLGDYLTGQDAFPTSEELGLDIVESLFQVVIPERIQELSAAIEDPDNNSISEVLSSQAEIFVGLAESINLPGLGEIAQAILQALELNPEQELEIAHIAIANLKAAQQAVANGDRDRGGEPSAELRQLAGITADSVSNQSEESAIDSAFDHDVEAFFATDSEDTASSQSEEIYAEHDFSGVRENQDAPVELVSEIWGEEEISLSEPETDSENSQQPVEQIWGEAIEEETQDSIVESEIVTSVSTSVEEVPISQISSAQTKSAPKSSPKSPSKPSSKAPISQTVRVNLESLENLNDLVGEILIQQNQNVLKDEQVYGSVQELISKIKFNEQVINQIIDLVDEICLSPQQQQVLQELPAKLQQITNQSPQSNHQSQLKLQSINALEQSSKLNQLLQLANESNLELSQIGEKIKNFNKQSRRSTQKQQRMLLNMRDELIETRMSPIGRIFNRFSPMLQQLANSYEKQVELKITGSHILVDKTVEEKLYNPLLHLVRNAFDHGVESPEMRVQAGKPEIGKIELRAYYQGSQTVIEVRDDGNGINLEKVKNRGIKQNLITPQQASNSSPAQLLELLFEPGFSTAAGVSELSGRGVGLDVVRTQIEELKGTISIDSVPGQGTVFSLQIPLTLTIAKLMLIQAKGITYALLIDAIERIILPTSHQVKELDGQKVLHWQTEEGNQVIPVRKLANLMEYPRTPLCSSSYITNDVARPVLLLRRQGGLIGLEVEQILGEQELVIRPLGSAIAPPIYVYGCSILRDSSLTLVIDGVALVKTFQEKKAYSGHQAYLASSLPPALPAAPQSSQQQQLPQASLKLAQTLLVVDDSSSLRHSISMSLEKISDRVLRAENGLKALEKLHQEKDINLVVCDLEMPYMNGFQFLKAVHQHPDFSQIPVIMLTSRDSSKHRQLAMQLGATAYLTKPHNEQELFETIGNILNQHSSLTSAQRTFV